MVALTADKGGDVNDYRGGDRPKPGIYHVVVKSAEETVSKQKGTQGYKVEFEVLAGTVPGQEGKELDETFWVTDKAVGRLIALALASGVMKPGESADSDVLLETPGHQLVIEVEEQDYDRLLRFSYHPPCSPSAFSLSPFYPILLPRDPCACRVPR